MANILIADDEQSIIELIELYLEGEDKTIFRASNGIEALEIVDKYPIDLGIIDIMMPMMNGFQVVRQIREKHLMPLIILSAREDFADKIHGLDIGADDYITKPFNALELKARVEAHLRRYLTSGSPQSTQRVMIGGFEVDFETCMVSSAGNPVSLTPKEFQILRLLASKPGRVFTKQQIYEAVWEETYYGDENTIRIHLSHLREKLLDDQGGLVVTVRGLGYKLEASKVVRL